MVLHDGSRHDGFLTPASKQGDLGTLQPHLFVGGKSFGFWGGMAGIRDDERTAFYQTLGKAPVAISPITLRRSPLVAEGQVDGFYRGTRTFEVEF